MIAKSGASDLIISTAANPSAHWPTTFSSGLVPQKAARNCDIISVDPGMLPGFMSALLHGLHNMERNEPRSGTTPTFHMTGEHRMLTGAGWSYRTNDRGWIIYRDPQTGRW